MKPNIFEVNEEQHNSAPTLLWLSILGQYNASENGSTAWSFVDMALLHPGCVQPEDTQQSQKNVNQTQVEGCQDQKIQR